MINVELTFEDKIKPYLILAEVFDKQNKNELRDLTLIQMIKQLGSKNKNIQNISMSNLIDTLRLNSIEEIKSVLEKTEKII